MRTLACIAGAKSNITKRYIFAGSWTMAWALVVLFFIPDSPEQPGRWFNEEEKILLKNRLARNMTGKDRTRFKKEQAVEAFLDPKIWLFLLIGAAVYVCNGGVTAVRLDNEFSSMRVPSSSHLYISSEPGSSSPSAIPRWTQFFSRYLVRPA